MLTRLTPHATAAADQPIFKVEMRRIGWGADAHTLIGYSMRRISTLLVGLAVIWAVLALLVLLLTAPGDSRLYNLWQMTAAAAGALVFTGGVGSLLIDFVSISSALDGINGDLLSGRWDLLKLANIREGHFAVAKHGIAQVRAWRRMIDVVAVRIGAGGLVIIAALIALVDFDNPSTPVSTAALEIGIACAMTGVVALEALWRMRVMTAVGLMVSAYTRSPLVSPLAAVGVTFGVWIAQTAIIASVGCGIVGLIFPILLFGGELCIVPFMLAGVSVGLYAFYEVLKQYCLRRVAFRLASLESAP